MELTFNVCGETSGVSGDKQLELLVKVTVDKVGVPGANPCEVKGRKTKKHENKKRRKVSDNWLYFLIYAESPVTAPNV